jgi:hypothetical protein
MLQNGGLKMRSNSFRKRVALAVVVPVLVLAGVWGGSSKRSPTDPSYRLPERNGWVFAHLEGSPSEIGYQHGSLFPREIEDVMAVAKLELGRETGRDWSFFRREAESMMWLHIEQEYRDELSGIARGAAEEGAHLDLWDIVALNGWLEWEYYVKQYNRTHPDDSTTLPSVPEHCSAFVATGSYTRDGRPVIAHNNWSSYMSGERWLVVFDIVPANGHRILMDGLPGLISSDDDFGLNDGGIMITETTIGGFEGYDPSGIPEFVRARKAMQYASSLDDFVAIMKEGNNGGYANTWLFADARTGEIGSLELGLKNVTFQRTRDGYFVGANFPINPKLTREETTFNTADSGSSGNARRVRWRQLMEENKGKIDVAAAKRFLADHFDVREGKEAPSERTICGHIDCSPRGMGTWQPPYGTAGAVQNKVADAVLAEQMSFEAAAGHACGEDFNAARYLEEHPEFSWEEDLLRDMPARPWTRFSAAQK